MLGELSEALDPGMMRRAPGLTLHNLGDRQFVLEHDEVRFLLVYCPDAKPPIWAILRRERDGDVLEAEVRVHADGSLDQGNLATLTAEVDTAISNALDRLAGLGAVAAADIDPEKSSLGEQEERE